SVLDRVSDVILFGALFWVLSQQHHRASAALALVSLVVALLVSHIRAEGEAAGLHLSEGFVQRLERYVLLMVGLTAPGALLPFLGGNGPPRHPAAGTSGSDVGDAGLAPQVGPRP